MKRKFAAVLRRVADRLDPGARRRYVAGGEHLHFHIVAKDNADVALKRVREAARRAGKRSAA